MAKRKHKTFRIPRRRNMPAHLKENFHRWFALLRWANGMAGLYGVPIYLCGSALRDDNAEPRDWDVRIRLPRKVFEAKFGGSADDWYDEGSTGIWSNVRWRWSAECVRMSRQASERTKLNIDFQIFPPAYWKHFAKRPRFRLDTRDRVRLGRKK